MNLIELKRALRQLRLGCIAAVLETRLLQAQAEPMAPIDLISGLVSDDLTRRGDRLLERRRKQAQSRDPQTTLDNFDFYFNKKINRSLIFTIDGTRKQHMELLATVPLLNMDNRGMRKSPSAAAEELLEIVRRCYERASTLLTSNRPVEDWGKLFGDSAAVTAVLDRLLHHGHLLKCGPRSWRTKMDLPSQEAKR